VSPPGAVTSVAERPPMTRFARLPVLFLIGLIGASSMAIQAQTAPTAVLQGPSAVDFGQSIDLSGTQSFAAPGQAIVHYTFRLDGGPPVQTSTAAHTFAFDPANPFAVGVHIATLLVTDDQGTVSSPDTRQIIVRDTVTPTAVIDMASVIPLGADVSASGGRSSDVGGAITTYQWSLDGGPSVQSTSPDVTFDVDAASPLPVGRHDLQLVVVDDSGNQSVPTSRSFIVADTTAPTAVLLAPALVAFGQNFTLDGASSFDIGGQITSYRWTIDNQSPVVTDTATFDVVIDPASPLAPGTHTVQLVVTDDGGNVSSPALAAVRIVDAQTPTAVVTIQSVVPFGQSAVASGTQSVDFDGTIIRYEWTLDGQAPVATPGGTFVVPASLAIGLHTLQLVVKDDSGNDSAPAVATFRVVDTTTPTAVISGAAFALYGAGISASGAQSFDIGGRIIRYTWSLDGQSPIVTDAPAITFPAPAGAPFAPGLHVIELVVTDDSGNDSEPTQFQVRVTDGVAPSAVLSAPTFVEIGHDIVLSGVNSFDIGGTVVRYEWTLEGQPPVVTPGPDYTFDVDPAHPLPLGRYDVQLVVSDDSGNQSTPDVKAIIVRDSTAPTAVITGPAEIVLGAPLALSGESSADIGGTITRYVWTLDGGPETASSEPTIVFGGDPASPLALGRHIATLEVTDDSGNQSSATAFAVDVVPPPDQTPPAITLATPSSAATYALHEVVLASYSCTDADSGVATCSGAVANGAAIDTATVGVKSFTVTATDQAGNQSQVTHSYQVGYLFTGFFAPVNNPPVVNAGQAGRTFPIKWRLADGLGRPVTALTAFVSLRDSAMQCEASPEDVLEDQLTDTAASTLRYDAAEDQFIYHWRTVKGVAGCRLLQLTLADGSKHYAKFKLR